MVKLHFKIGTRVRVRDDERLKGTIEVLGVETAQVRGDDDKELHIVYLDDLWPLSDADIDYSGPEHQRKQ